MAAANLDAHVLHSDVVPLGRFAVLAGLVAGLVLLQPVSNRLGRLHHVLQLVRVRRRVALQVSLLVGEGDKLEGFRGNLATFSLNSDKFLSVSLRKMVTINRKTKNDR